MLTALRASERSTIRASHARREDGPFVCPDCDEQVDLHQGRNTIPHFAHRSTRICTHTTGETELHRKSKIEIFEALKNSPEVDRVEMEFSIGYIRADILARIRGELVAIEVQISTLSPESISFRTQEYRRRGIAVLWILEWTPKIEGLHFTPRPFERWLHATYFGRVYYWKAGLEIIPYQFQPRHIHVEPRTWFDKKGRQQRSGGFVKIAKRRRIAVRGRPLNLMQDFRSTTRPPWQSETLRIPEARLYLDSRTDFLRG